MSCDPTYVAQIRKGESTLMWTRYRVTWQFTTKLCGSVPADPEIVKAWTDARKPTVRPPGARSMDEINEEVLNSLARGEEFAEAECNMLTFQRHEGICCMRAATIRAHLKDCVRQIAEYHVGRIDKERSFSTRFINCVYPDPMVYWVPILRPNGSPVTKHDGEQDKPVHVRGPRGMQSALKRFEWIEPARLDFTLLVLTAAGTRPGKKGEPPVPIPSISEKDLGTVMTYGGVHGYAGERGDGEGKYTFTLTKEASDGDGSEEAHAAPQHQRSAGSARVRVQPAARRQDRRKDR